MRICNVVWPAANTPSRVMGATFSLFAFGAAVGGIVQGWTADWIGRKKTLAVAGLTSTVGAALVAGSVNVPMLVTTRILHGFGLGMILCLVPLYTTEIAPPKTRGIYSGMTVIGYGMGYLM
jgi:MFS family permease